MTPFYPIREYLKLDVGASVRLQLP